MTLPSRAARSARTSEQTDDEGRGEVAIPTLAEGGWVRAFVRARGYSEWRNLGVPDDAVGKPAVITAGKDIELVVALRRGRTLAGTVVDAEGKPVAGARFTLTLSGPGWCSWPQAMTVGKTRWPDGVRSDGEGRWEMLSFPYEAVSRREGSRWVLTVEHDRMAPAIVQSLETLPSPDGVVTIRTTMRRGRALSGRVTDEEGKPVAGAEVSLTGNAKPDEPMCVRVRAEANTSGDGSFTVSGLDDRAYELHVKAKGYAASEPRDLRVHDPQRSPVTLVLAKGEDLRGKLLDDEGRPLPGVEVHLLSRQSKLRESVETSSDGSFVFEGLPTGKVTLTSFMLFTRETQVPSPPIEIRLPQRCHIVVLLRAAEDGRPVRSPARLYFRGPGFSSVRRLDSDDGRVRLGSLVPAEYTLTADVPGRAVTEKSVRVPQGEGTVEVVLDVPKGFALHGRVTDLEGRAIAGARVEASRDPYDHREAVTDGEGAYLLEGLNDSRTLLGNWYVFAASAEGRATEVDLEVFARFSLGERTLDFKLGSGGTVRGTVKKRDGSPAAGLLVKALVGGMFYTAVHVPTPTVVTDENGRYELTHVNPGKTRLVVGDSERNVRVEEGKTLERDFTVER